MADSGNQAERMDPGFAPLRSASRGLNPFNPGFGTAPPRFAGRHHLIAEITARLERGPGRYEFHTVVVGPRGVGKTVLLAEVLRRGSQQNRWVPINWNASRPLHQVLTEHAPMVERAFGGRRRKPARHSPPSCSTTLATASCTRVPAPATELPLLPPPGVRIASLRNPTQRAIFGLGWRRTGRSRGRVVSQHGWGRRRDESDHQLRHPRSRVRVVSVRRLE